MPEASLIGLVNVLLRRRWSVVIPALVLAGIVGGVTLLQPRTYTAEATFVPQGRRTSPDIGGLAAELGVGLMASDPMLSPQFYVDLVMSREILSDVASTQFQFQTDTGPVAGTLAEIYQSQAPNEAERRAALIRRLRKDVASTPESQTGVVRLTVTSPYAPLSARIAERILELVNRFNLETRQSQARAERQFVERRLVGAEADLRNAETSLQSFLQRNREFGPTSPLSVERERLERAVDLHRSTYTQLVRTLEQVRIEEVRDVPIITVIERPEAPAFPDPRNLIRNVILALIGGLVLGICLAFGREYLGVARTRDGEDFERFAHLRREAVQDLTHPWRPIARLFGRGR